MSVLSHFRLGRPAFTTLFEFNPTALDYAPRTIADFGRGLNGSGNKVTLSRDRPLLRINGNYISPDQFNQFASLMRVDDVPLVFQAMDFDGTNVWESWGERVIPTSTTTIPIPENSFTLAAQLVQHYGGYAMMKLKSLYLALLSDKAFELGVPDVRWQNGTGFSVLTDIGIWGHILKQNFNNLATGLLTDAGDGWLSSGNGTTKDAFITDTPSEVLEGTKGVIFVTDGVGATSFIAERRNGGHLTTGGYVGEYHIMKWKAQMVRNITGCVAGVKASSVSGIQVWQVNIEVTSPTTADLVIARLGAEVYRAALTNPFSAHEFWLKSENRASKGGNLLQVWVDTVSVYDSSAFYVGNFDGLEFSAQAPTGGGSGTIWRLDDIDCYDGDGYDPSTGLINIVTGTPLATLDPLFVTYQYTGVAVNLAQVPFRTEGGWVDFYRYGFQLEGM